MDTSINLNEVVEKHGKWLRDEEGGERWSCSWRADLRSADLSGADLRSADLRSADLSGANLSGANLSGADLRSADLSGANLSGANLSGADLSGANLSGANLSGANLSGADLRSADLSGANLRSADLSGANLSGANLSGAKNLLNPVVWLAETFVSDELGYIVYKAIGNTTYNPPKSWKIKAGSLLEEIPNPLPTCECGCGVNFATLAWVKSNHSRVTIWRCRIRWLDLPGVVVPYNTDGKARCSRLELIEIVNEAGEPAEEVPF
jgi:hypothetical protein